MSDDLVQDAEDGTVGAPAEAVARERLLDQDEIDALTGFQAAAPAAPEGGWRAMAGGGPPRPEPLPILQIAFTTLAERLSKQMRGFLGRDVEVTASIPRPDRYGSAVEDIVLPTCIATFRAQAWDGGGMIVIGPDFTRIVLDCLMGAAAEAGDGGPAVRPLTAIEVAILTRLAASILAEAESAFDDLAPTPFELARVETDPRLCGIARPGDSVLVTTFRFDVEGRPGAIDWILPWATMEPVRGLLRESFPGIKLGRDAYWASHLATQAGRSETAADVVLHEMRVPLRRVMGFGIGDTLMFDRKPTDPVEVRCGRLTLTRGRVGHVDGRIAVRVTEPLRPLGARGGQAPR